MIEHKKQIPGRKLETGEEFQFECHTGLTCFNTCCKNKRLNLYPYDILRIRTGLEKSSEEILEKYIELEIEPETGWPALRIKLEETGKCPFVKDKGCSIYDHRPTCCRMYPLTRAFASKENDEFDEIYYITRPENCLGHKEQKRVKIKQWIEDQQLQPYQQANNQIMRLYLHPKRKRPMALSDQEMHAIIMALYNLDVFARFIQQEEFSSTFNISKMIIDQALTSDEKLLKLGQDWLTSIIFGQK